MIKYIELNEQQKILVDTRIALDIGKLIGASAEIPNFISNESYMEWSRNKYSRIIRELELSEKDICSKAKECGINSANPEGYIKRAIEIVKKLNKLAQKQIAYAIPQQESAGHKSYNAAHHTNIAGSH